MAKQRGRADASLIESAANSAFKSTNAATNVTAVVDGEPTDFAMRVALCNLPDGSRIELIQPEHELGVIVELGGAQPGFAMPEPVEVYPA